MACVLNLVLRVLIQIAKKLPVTFRTFVVVPSDEILKPKPAERLLTCSCLHWSDQQTVRGIMSTAMVILCTCTFSLQPLVASKTNCPSDVGKHITLLCAQARPTVKQQVWPGQGPTTGHSRASTEYGVLQISLVCGRMDGRSGGPAVQPKCRCHFQRFDFALSVCTR